MYSFLTTLITVHFALFLSLVFWGNKVILGMPGSYVISILFKSTCFIFEHVLVYYWVQTSLKVDFVILVSSYFILYFHDMTWYIRYYKFFFKLSVNSDLAFASYTIAQAILLDFLKWISCWLLFNFGIYLTQ